VSSLLKQRYFLGLMLAGSGAAAPAPTPDPADTVQVWSYNYAGAEPETVSRAQHAATRILERAGIALEWVDCPRTAAERELFPRCRQDSRRRWVVIRIFSGKPSAELVSSSHVFGKAYLDDDGYGYRADVYMAGAELLADGSPSERAAILGHLIAHELGHLFLASTAHSGRGIMRSHWSNADLRLALRGGLLFDSRQKRRIAKNLKSGSASRQGAGPNVFAAEARRLTADPFEGQ
jgi:hypothetical protein